MSYSIDRLIWQYRDKPNVRALIASVLVEFDNIGGALDALRTRLDIDLSQGVQLDGIGELIGMPRPITVSIDPTDVFAFDDTDDAKGFSGVGRPDVGGRMIGLNGLIIGPMPDAEYRTLLRATIFATSGLSDVDHLSGYGNAVTEGDVFLTEGVGHVNLNLPRPVSSTEADLIRDTFPVAAGISVGYISYALADTDSFRFGSVTFPDTETTGGFDNIYGDGSLLTEPMVLNTDGDALVNTDGDAVTVYTTTLSVQSGAWVGLA